jgi:hypothetical protein
LKYIKIIFILFIVSCNPNVAEEKEIKVHADKNLGVCRTFNNSESKKMGFSEPIIGF